MQATIDALVTALGDDAVLTGAAISPRYHADWSAEPPHQPAAVIRPDSTAAVATILRVCSAHGQPVVVQGGMTGLCGGATPRGGEIAISLERLNGIEELDRDSMTMTVRAGTPLQVIQTAAEAADFRFPLDLGARGSCQIGGNISTNAGGNQVLRYGMTRNLVLGIEAVLADGTVISSLNKILKNNAGYDLKQLFIGTEGTLGVVTRAVLRLFPRARSRCSALLALRSFADVTRLLQYLGAEFGGALGAFEAMWASYFDFIVEAVRKTRSPFAERHPVYVLTEIEGADAAADRARFEQVLHATMQSGIIADAVIAQSERERSEFWAIRDGVGEIGNVMKHVANFDVSLPVSAMQPFLRDVEAELRAAFPEITMLVFGHIGDNNLHLIITTGNDGDIKPIYRTVYAAVGAFRGSVSAEHGIGVQKLAYLGHSRSEAEIALMRRLKQALDPQGLLNPGRVVG